MFNDIGNKPPFVAKLRGKLGIITVATAALIVAVALIVAAVLLTTKVIIPTVKYNAAVGLMESGQYTEAITAFEGMDGYRDSTDQIVECRYLFATELLETGQYDEAINAFRALDDYKDSADKVTECKYLVAVALMEGGQHSEAINAFRALNDYKDSADKITECKYLAAVALMEAGQYSDSIGAFRMLGDYKDSADQITKCKYLAAIALMESGKYSEAVDAFRALGDYKDSKEKINESNYLFAVALMDAGQYTKAIDAFEALGDYKDSSNLVMSCQLLQFKNAKVGDYVTFGAYEQDGNTFNGKEEIEWLVLDIQDDKALLVSSNALDSKPYNADGGDVTWETCTLRSWLNEDFLKTAFSIEEQSMIPTVTVSADKNPEYSTNPGNDTQDKVFLLSIQETKKYVASWECELTQYAVDMGLWVNWDEDDCPFFYWLRSPGCEQDYAAWALSDYGAAAAGELVSYDDIAVRPAIWVDIGN